MPNRIRRISVKMERQAKKKPRHTCVMCHVVFATHDTDKVVYVHLDSGDTIAICYGHLLNIANRSGNWFPSLPLRKAKDFDLVKYLNEVRGAVANQLIDIKVLNTFTIITELLDITGLSKYIGGTAELFSVGFKDTKILAIETVPSQTQPQLSAPIIN